MSGPNRPTEAPTWATDASFASGPANGHPTKVAPPGWPAVAQGAVPGNGTSSELRNKLDNNLCAWVQHFKDAQAVNWTCPVAAKDLGGTFKGRSLGGNPTDYLCFIGGEAKKLFYSLPSMFYWVAVTIPAGGSAWPFNLIADNGAAKTMLIAENDGAGNWDTYLFTGGVGLTTLALKSANSKANAIPMCLTITATGRWIAGGKTTGPLSAIWYSDNDGATWTEVLLPDAGAAHRPVYSIACKAGLLVALGSNGAADLCTAWTSADNGATWTEHTDITAGQQMFWATRGMVPLSYCAARDVFLTVGGRGHVYTSADGVTWTARTTIPITNGSDAAWIVTNGGAFVVGFRGASLSLDQADDRQLLVYSTDAGVTWRPIGDAPFTSPEVLKSLAPVPGGFAAVCADNTGGTLSVGRSILL